MDKGKGKDVSSYKDKEGKDKEVVYSLPNVYTTLATPQIILCLQILILNIFVIIFYKNRIKQFVPMMYVMISIVDMCSAVGFIYNSITCVLYNGHLISTEGMEWNFLLSFYITALFYRCSVFYNVVLGTCRTIQILSPFYQIKRRWVILACVIYLSIWFVLIGYEMYIFYNKYLHFGVGILNLAGSILSYETGKYSAPFTVVFILIITVPFILPSVIVIMTCAMQIYTLRHNTMSTDDTQKQVTVTIVMLSVLFVICNSAYSIYMVLVYYMHSVIQLTALFQLIFGAFMPIINAAFSPVIIIVRSDGFRNKLGAVLRRKPKIQPQITLQTMSHD